jgi:hypothetical protein
MFPASRVITYHQREVLTFRLEEFLRLAGVNGMGEVHVDVELAVKKNLEHRHVLRWFEPLVVKGA